MQQRILGPDQDCERAQHPQEVRRRPDKIRKVLDRRTLESISTEELNDYVVAFDEIRDVGKHGSPERRDHRPILQAERKTWPDSAAPPPGRKGVRLKLRFWGMRTHEASSIIQRESPVLLGTFVSRAENIRASPTETGSAFRAGCIGL
jgi:hypothetical protein